MKRMFLVAVFTSISILSYARSLTIQPTTSTRASSADMLLVLLVPLKR